MQQGNLLMYSQRDMVRAHTPHFGLANRTAPSKPYTRPTQRLSGPPLIYKLGAETHMLQLNI